MMSKKMYAINLLAAHLVIFMMWSLKRDEGSIQHGYIRSLLQECSLKGTRLKKNYMSCIFELTLFVSLLLTQLTRPLCFDVRDSPFLSSFVFQCCTPLTTQVTLAHSTRKFLIKEMHEEKNYLSFYLIDVEGLLSSLRRRCFLACVASDFVHKLTFACSLCKTLCFASDISLSLAVSWLTNS